MKDGIIIGIIVISILILLTIWISFGDSLKRVQYYCQKYLYLDFGDGSNESLNALKWCTLNCVLFSNLPFFNFLIPGAVVLYDEHRIPAGYYVRDGKHLLISFVSTANLDHVKIATNNSLNGLGFHSGYFKRTQELLEQFIFVLTGIESIIVCGHSMAGAMAGIAGYLLSRRFPFSRVSVYAFGSPKFCSLEPDWKSLPNLTYHDYINTADPVIYKPLNLEYIRLDSENFESKSNVFVKHFIDTGNDNVNHSIKVYREIVLQRETTEIPRRPHRPDEILSRWFLDMLG